MLASCTNRKSDDVDAPALTDSDYTAGSEKQEEERSR